MIIILIISILTAIRYPDVESAITLLIWHSMVIWQRLAKFVSSKFIEKYNNETENVQRIHSDKIGE